jgi:hypothetical protein
MQPPCRAASSAGRPLGRGHAPALPPILLANHSVVFGRVSNVFCIIFDSPLGLEAVGDGLDKKRSWGGRHTQAKPRSDERVQESGMIPHLRRLGDWKAAVRLMPAPSTSTPTEPRLPTPLRQSHDSSGGSGTVTSSVSVEEPGGKAGSREPFRRSGHARACDPAAVSSWT